MLHEIQATCSAHWIGLHPYPAPDAWTAIDDSEQRTLAALCELYAYHGTVELMLANVRRDAQLLPALRAAMAGAGTHFAAVEKTLDAGWDGDAVRRRAALALALDFATWQQLTQRLSDDDAAALMTRMVACAQRERRAPQAARVRTAPSPARAAMSSTTCCAACA